MHCTEQFLFARFTFSISWINYINLFDSADLYQLNIVNISVCAHSCPCMAPLWSEWKFLQGFFFFQN